MTNGDVRQIFSAASKYGSVIASLIAASSVRLASALLDQAFEFGEAFEGDAEGELDSGVLENQDDGVAEEGAVQADFETNARQGRADRMNTGQPLTSDVQGLPSSWAVKTLLRTGSSSGEQATQLVGKTIGQGSFQQEV